MAAPVRIAADGAAAPIYRLLLSTVALLGLTTLVAGLASRLGWPPIAFLFWSALGGGLVLAALAVVAGERTTPSAALLRYGPGS